MLEHLILRLKAMSRETMLLVAILLVVAASFIPYSFPQQSKGYNYSITFYKDALTNIGSAEGSGFFQGAPADLLAYTAAQKQAGIDILVAHASGDAMAEFDARLRFQQAEYSETLAGYSTESVISSERKLAFYEQLIEKQQFYLFSNCSEMPSSYYLASEILSLSPALLFFPATVALVSAFASAGGTRSREFERLVPVSGAAILAADFLAGLIASLSALLLALLPITVFQTVRNGFGDLTYPVVDIVNSHVMITTVGGYLWSLLVLVVAGYCFLGTIALLVSRFSDSRMILLFILLLSALAGSLPMYLQLASGWRVIEFLPWTYFTITPVIGIVASYENTAQIAGTTLPMGLMVLGISTVVTVALAAIAEKAVPFLATLFGAGRVVKGR
jgi:hypothetical protein